MIFTHNSPSRSRPRAGSILLSLVVISLGVLPRIAVSATAAAPAPLKMLTWNIQMLPTFPSVAALNKGQAMRAPWIIDYLNASDYSVVCLQEVIDPKMTALLQDGLKKTFPYIVSADAKGGFSGTSGGILFVSRIPIKYVDHIVYKNVKGVDALAEKGCVLVAGEHNGVPFQIAGTHLQAGFNEVKDKQIPEIAEGILQKHKQEGTPQFLVGDMNIDTADADRYALLLKTTEMQDFPLDDKSPFTVDSENSWKEGKRKKGGGRIDHVLLNARGTKTTVTRQTVQRARREHEGKTIDLADHYGVVAEVTLEK
jgi:endonuclease/exonuclease/phosphatase family metal-dependent hydrolase